MKCFDALNFISMRQIFSSVFATDNVIFNYY